MKIIIEGSASEVNKIVKENAIRVRRGLITISPLSSESEDAPIIDDENDVILDDVKDAPIIDDEKKPKKGGKKEKVIED